MTQYNRHRRDNNHKAIVDALRGCGVTVRDTSQIGDGGPDLIAGCVGRDYQIEVKSDHGELSKDQTDFIQDWRGQTPVVLWSADDAIRWVNQMRCAP